MGRAHWAWPNGPIGPGPLGWATWAWPFGPGPMRQAHWASWPKCVHVGLQSGFITVTEYNESEGGQGQRGYIFNCCVYHGIPYGIPWLPMSMAVLPCPMSHGCGAQGPAGTGQTWAFRPPSKSPFAHKLHAHAHAHVPCHMAHSPCHVSDHDACPITCRVATHYPQLCSSLRTPVPTQTLSPCKCSRALHTSC